MDAQPYPIDFDKLYKGQILTVEELESALGFQRDTPEYRFAVQSLRSRIQIELSARGLAVIPCEVKGSLHLLVGAEASDYATREFRRRMRSAGRIHHASVSLDEADMNDAEIARHQANVLERTKILAAVSHARREIRIEDKRKREEKPPEIEAGG